LKEEIWDLWGRQMQPLSATTPLMTGVGNHEVFYNWAAFEHRFTMPVSAVAGMQSNKNFWFSFDLGNVHILSFSTEHNYTIGSPQWLWMEADLKRANERRATTPWILVTGHRPFYSSEPDYCECEGGKWIAKDRIVNLEPLLIRYHVDITVTGHLHCYERIHPNINGTRVHFPVTMPNSSRVEYHDPQYPVHIVQGNAGGLQEEKWIEQRPPWSAVRYANGLNPDRKEDWSEGDEAIDLETGTVNLHLPEYNYSDTFGFGRLTAVNRTHLRYKYNPVTGDMDDEFWIVKT
jgi:hypothetical protein